MLTCLVAMIASCAGGACWFLGNKRADFYIYYLIVFTRFLYGLAVGLSSSIIPVFATETLTFNTKDLFLKFFQLAITFGIPVITGAGLVIDTRYDIILYLGNVWPVLLLVSTSMMPESIQWHRKRYGMAPPANVGGKEEAAPLLSTVDTSVEGVYLSNVPGGWRGLFSRHHVAALLVGIAMAVALALTGINAVMFFAPSIFDAGGYADIKTQLTIALGATNFVATVVGILMYYVIARRVMLVGGLALLSLALVVLAVCRIAFTEEHWAELIATICVFVFVVGFAVGPGLSFWPIVNTYYHPAVASQAAGLLNLLQWGENLVLALAFPPFAHAVNGYAFLPFAVVGVLTTAYIAAFLKSPAQVVARS